MVRVHQLWNRDHWSVEWWTPHQQGCSCSITVVRCLSLYFLIYVSLSVLWISFGWQRMHVYWVKKREKKNKSWRRNQAGEVLALQPTKGLDIMRTSTRRWMDMHIIGYYFKERERTHMYIHRNDSDTRHAAQKNLQHYCGPAYKASQDHARLQMYLLTLHLKVAVTILILESLQICHGCVDFWRRRVFFFWRARGSKFCNFKQLVLVRKFCTLSDFFVRATCEVCIWHIHSTQCFVPRWTSALLYTPLKWPSTCHLRCFAAHSYYIVVECWRKVLLSLIQFLTVACCSSQLSLARSVLPCWLTWPMERT